MPSLPRPGDRLAGFRIERELGHGTTGTVYVAHQDGLDRKVALKVVGRPLAEDAGFRERFRREARTAAGLDHPNVVQILEAGEDDAHLWLAMRLVDGPDLRVLLRRTGRLEPAQAVAVVEQIAAALDAAHAAGLVHRDVKPGNVLIEDGPGRDLHVELADFGLARAPGVDDVAGTPGYAAPEQLAGAEAGPAADVFGLGCVLFELLTGTPPPTPVEVPAGVPWRRGPGSDDGSGAGSGAAPDGPAAASLAGAADDAPAAASSDAPAAPTVESAPTGDTGDGVGPSSADGAAVGTSTPDGAAVTPSRVYGDRLPLTPSVALPRLGGAFDPAVQRATAADPADRFASAGELAMWARAALAVPKAAIAPDPADPVRAAAATPASPAEVGPAAPTWEIPPPPRRRRRGRKLLVAAFLAAVLGLLAAAFVFIGDLGDSSRGRQMGTTPTPQGPAAGAQAGGRGAATGSGGGSSAGSGGASSAGSGGASSGGAAGSGSGAGPGGAAGSATGAGGSAGRAGGPGSTASGSGSGRSGAAGGGSSSDTGGDAGASGGGGRGSGAAAGGSSSAGSTASGGGAAPGTAGSAGAAGGAGSGGSAGSSSVPRAGRDAPTGATSAALPPIPAGASRFGGGTWVLDLPTAEGWRQTAVQELDGGARIVTRLQRPDAVRLVVESLPGRTAVVGVPGARTFPVRLPDAGRTDGALYRGGRYAMCSGGNVCAALPANGPSGGVLLIAGAHRAAGAKRIARRAASGLRVR